MMTVAQPAGTRLRPMTSRSQRCGRRSKALLWSTKKGDPALRPGRIDIKVPSAAKWPEQAVNEVLKMVALAAGVRGRLPWRPFEVGEGQAYVTPARAAVASRLPLG
eukprot:8606424-Alexandrium_andersonii.AAC.1